MAFEKGKYKLGRRQTNHQSISIKFKQTKTCRNNINSMKKITIFGAGKSSSSLIKYLLDAATLHSFEVVVADLSIENAQKKIQNHPKGLAIEFSLSDEPLRKKLIEDSDVVISMLPAHLHIDIAKDCVFYGKHLVTASYISKEMQSLDEEVKAKGLVFMNECGLDPGIDHMSAMAVLDKLRDKGAEIVLFESFCGGLISPESDDNLWNYKFTWNPRNVVLAGQSGTAKFLQQGKYKYIPYSQLFRRTEFLNIDGYGKFEAYANRDSLSYQKIYGLENAHTIFRGTIRRLGFSRAWNVFVQLGMTDDSYTIENSENMSYREFTNLFLAYHPTDSIEIKLRLALNIQPDDILWERLEEIELFNPDKKIGLKNASPAQILEKILSEKWTLNPTDKDMIVMYHKFGYKYEGQHKQIDATMVCIGDDQVHTAMSKTVGLPVAIIALQILNNKIKTPGVQLPIRREIYQPVLDELASFGIEFIEKEVPYKGIV